MLRLSSLGSVLLLLVWTVTATSRPEEEPLRATHNQHTRDRLRLLQDGRRNQGGKTELGALQQDLLKLLSGWMDSPDSNSLEMDREASVEDKLVPRSSSMKFPRLYPRERKAPCKNFFWKTFTMC
ncbi:somatostatin-2-like isoform X1 [Ascaphus truei]|uniref:somatostatin-2-like isoform X1 n=1 Tax=Ascaphus truei TaxID=8439 RepID=UPI003F5A2C3F